METPLEKQVRELTEKKATLENDLVALGNAANTSQLRKETLEKEIEGLTADIAALIKQKEDAEKGAADSVKTLKGVREKVAAEIAALNKSVTDKESEKKVVEHNLAEINAAITVATNARITTEELLAKAQAAHKAFMTHAESEKTRITGELKQLDDTAKAQVVVIESQTALQTSLDEQNSIKSNELAGIEDNIEIATKRLATVTTDVATAEREHAQKLAAMAEEFETISSETAAKTKKAKDELEAVEADLEHKKANAIAMVTREEQLDAKEAYLKERYLKANVPW
jgi:predicted  nucleic acid-binding Zn-ribbon protein